MYEYRYEGFVKSFDNDIVSNMTFSIVNGSDGIGDYRIIGYNYHNEIALAERSKGLSKVVRLNKNISASMVLYKPDLENYDEIKHYSVMEYIYRQLEMCDFTKFPDNEKIVRDLAHV